MMAIQRANLSTRARYDRNRRSGLFFVVALVVSPAVFASDIPVCVIEVSSNEPLKEIVAVYFNETLPRLKREEIVTDEFYASARQVRYTICNDRTFDVMVLNRAPPYVVFDEAFLSLLFVQSRTLVLGQRLAERHQSVGTLDLHRALMENIYEQNALGRPASSLELLVSQAVGVSVDPMSYVKEGDSEREQRFFVQGIYFLFMHELCHVANGHLSKRTAASQALLREMELEADACAFSVINADENQDSGSPISFFSAFLVMSTQSLLERVPALENGERTHPSPVDRLQQAYRISEAQFKDSQHYSRYMRSLRSVLAHSIEIGHLSSE